MADTLTRQRLPTLLLPALLLAGCTTQEVALSRTLAPVIEAVKGPGELALFRARVDKGVLEVWGRVRRDGGDYGPAFDPEIAVASAWCAALATSELTFREDWSTLTLQVTSEYGSQWRWKNALGYTEARISRDTLRELGQRQAPAAECPRHWQFFAYKVGPPDYGYVEWRPAP